jgi:hypothetical protein
VCGTAQFLPAADHIVILDGCGVRAQGSWKEIQSIASSSISKFTFQQRAARDAETVPTASSSKLTAQLQARQEAQVDLARRTGDLGLYGR